MRWNDDRHVPVSSRILERIKTSLRDFGSNPAVGSSRTKVAVSKKELKQEQSSVFHPPLRFFDLAIFELFKIQANDLHRPLYPSDNFPSYSIFLGPNAISSPTKYSKNWFSGFCITNPAYWTICFISIFSLFNRNSPP